MLSLLECVPSLCMSLPPTKPLPKPSRFRAVGGDLEEGLIIEFVLPLLELFLLLPCRSLARWKFMRLLTAEDCPIQPAPGLFAGMAPKGVLNLFTCGVVRIESSISSASMRSSSSSELVEESDAIIFTLPKELEMVIRSLFPFPIVDHKDIEL